MKTLYVIRHGKSSWDDPTLTDRERPLKPRGIKNAKEAGQLIHLQPEKPELILSSPAVRAWQTAKLIAQELELTNEQLQVNSTLYMPDLHSLLDVIKNTKSVDNLGIVGHEPSLSSLVNHFLSKPLESLITASVTVLFFDCHSWPGIHPNNLKSAHHFNRHDWNGKPLI